MEQIGKLNKFTKDLGSLIEESPELVIPKVRMIARFSKKHNLAFFMFFKSKKIGFIFNSGYWSRVSSTGDVDRAMAGLVSVKEFDEYHFIAEQAQDYVRRNPQDLPENLVREALNDRLVVETTASSNLRAKGLYAN